MSLVRPTRRLVDACRISRLNQHYRSAVQLCQLFLDQSGVELDAGDISAPAFFFPMAIVFQEAVSALLKERLGQVASQSSRAYQPVEGQPARTLTIVPDITVGVRPPLLVVDTKYARPEALNQYGGWSFHNEHVCQVAFYALSFGCPGVLVYPKVAGTSTSPSASMGLRSPSLRWTCTSKDLPAWRSWSSG